MLFININNVLMVVVNVISKSSFFLFIFMECLVIGNWINFFVDDVVGK